jgi:hypothetical protein
MSRVSLSGVSLIAAAVAGLIGSILEPRLADISWSMGAWLTLVAAAVSYRHVTGAARRAVPAAALAVLGIVACLWTIETTLRIALGDWTGSSIRIGWWTDLAGSSPGPLRLLAVAGAGIGLALLTAAAGRARLLPRRVAASIAAIALLSVVTADPPMPYVFGAAPLGIALLWTVKRAGDQLRPGPADRDRGFPAIGSNAGDEPMSCAALVRVV